LHRSGAWLRKGPGSSSGVLPTDNVRFTVRRARLAPAMISTPGHRASRGRQRGPCQLGVIFSESSPKLPPIKPVYDAASASCILRCAIGELMVFIPLRLELCRGATAYPKPLSLAGPGHLHWVVDESTEGFYRRTALAGPVGARTATGASAFYGERESRDNPCTR
jgi:hypothetical protein